MISEILNDAFQHGLPYSGQAVFHNHRLAHGKQKKGDLVKEILTFVDSLLKPFTMKIPAALLIPLLFAGFACESAPKEEAEQSTTEQLTEAERSEYIDKGKQITQATFAELSGQLSQAIEEGGVPNAIKYCNVVAYPLVDSLSQVHDAVIRRTSLKVRNPKDAPTEAEKVMLQTYHERAGAGEEPKPHVKQLEEGRIAFYAPIKIQPLCLNCHGKVGKDVKQEHYDLIKQLYPEDEATGYELGELRGMWSITFTKL